LRAFLEWAEQNALTIVAWAYVTAFIIAVLILVV